MTSSHPYSRLATNRRASSSRNDRCFVVALAKRRRVDSEPATTRFCSNKASLASRALIPAAISSAASNVPAFVAPPTVIVEASLRSNTTPPLTVYLNQRGGIPARNSTIIAHGCPRADSRAGTTVIVANAS